MPIKNSLGVDGVHANLKGDTQQVMSSETGYGAHPVERARERQSKREGGRQRERARESEREGLTPNWASARHAMRPSGEQVVNSR